MQAIIAIVFIAAAATGAGLLSALFFKGVTGGMAALAGLVSKDDK